MIISLGAVRIEIKVTNTVKIEVMRRVKVDISRVIDQATADFQFGIIRESMSQMDVDGRIEFCKSLPGLFPECINADADAMREYCK